MSPAARAILAGDYPEYVKQKVLLTARGALAGKRTCLVCGEMGLNSRVHVPPEALRVDQPDFRAIVSYWVCAAHVTLAEDDPEITEALQRKGGKR